MIKRSFGIEFDLNSKLIASDGVSGDEFGCSVDISDNGNYAIVGAYGYNDYDGKAYIYEYDSNNNLWIENTVVSHPNDRYECGYSVSISDNGYAIVGCPTDSGTYVNQGSAFIYGRDDSTDEWNVVASLSNDSPGQNDFCGYSVSISGDYAIVGCHGDDSNQGSAVIYQLDSTSDSTWNQFGDKLVASDDYYSSTPLQFGYSVSITSGNNGVFAIIGARMYNIFTGCAFIFEYDSTSGSFIQVSMLTADDGDEMDAFGISVSISLDDSSGNVNAIVGAWGDDDKGEWSGSSYIFEREMDCNGDVEWNQISKLVSDDGEAYDNCGFSVSIYNNVAMVACPRDKSVYVYEQDNTWSLSSKLTANDGETGDFFGNAVSLTNNFALIGVYVYSVILDPTIKNINENDYVALVANTRTNSNNNNNNNSFVHIAIASFIGGILFGWLSLIIWRNVRQICSKTHKKLINNSEYQSLL